jgi:hypothetical protein
MFLAKFRPTLAIGLTVALGLVGLVPAQEIQDPPEPTGDAGYFYYSGGAAIAKRARTQTAPTTFPEGGWRNLPGAVLSYPVAAGTSRLFNVAFSAECRVNNGGPDDQMRIRIIDTATGLVLEPNDGAQVFCSATGYATHKGNWVRRFAAGNHNLQVQFFLVDGVPFENVPPVTASIDDWTFEVVIYI